jgi:hypothetical protein
MPVFYYRQPPTPQIITDGLIMHLDAGNPASYPGSGATWTDLTLSGNNGALNGGVTYTGSNGGALIFDGTTGYVVTPNTTVYQNVTLSVWFHSNNATPYGGLISKSSFFASSITDFPISIYKILDNVTVVLSSGNDFSYDAILSSSVPNNTWNNVVATFDQSNLNLYLNTIKSSTTASFSLSVNSQPWTIGRASQEYEGGIGMTYFNDKIAVVSMYNRVLTDQEVAQNFEATRTRFGL